MPSPAAAVFSILLVFTGVAKLRRPRDTSRALRQLGFPASLQLTITMASAEIAVGVWALITGSMASMVAQASVYAGFLLWMIAATARGIPIESCGCVGRPDTPPYWGHLLLNGIAIATTLIGVAGTPLISAGPTAVATTSMLALIGAWLAWEILNTGAVVSGLIRQ